MRGRVERPGTYSLPRGTTIQGGIDAAGGVYDPQFGAPVLELIHSNSPLEHVAVLEEFWKTTTLFDGDTVRVPLAGF